MIRAYSQRLLPPFSGVVQIAESASTRAQSFDGLNWDIHFLPASAPGGNLFERPQGYALDRSYYPVGHIRDGALKTYIFPAFLDHDAITEGITELHTFLSSAEVPFEAADRYEYWLLDGIDESPLALILSCCDESLMASLPSQAAWTALPHSKLKISNTAGEKARSEAPVNQRFQDLIARRAGSRPRAAWFDRSGAGPNGFPGLHVREDWPHAEQDDLCQRYLQGMAPRLLLQQGLCHDDRERMEIAARKQALAVEEYFPLYPEVNDEGRMATIRVEARLLRNAPPVTEIEATERPSVDGPLSKDMRIFDT